MLNLTDKASLKNEFNLLNLPKVFPKSEIKYTGVSPIIEKLWYIALDDAEKNYCLTAECMLPEATENTQTGKVLRLTEIRAIPDFSH